MFTKTRHPFLLVGKIGGDWSYFDPTDRPEGSPSRVGPIYKSKTEALADGPRYWRDNWGWHEEAYFA